MPKYMAKLSKFGGQFRVTVPKGLVEMANWEDVEFVILELAFPNEIRMRRFMDAESLGIERKEDRHGSDR